MEFIVLSSCGSSLNLAGKPIANFHGGTSLVTSAPAATIAPSPISTPGSSVAFAPIDAPCRKIGPLRSDFFLIGYLSLARTAQGPMNTLSSMVTFRGIYTFPWILTLLPIAVCPSTIVFVPISTLFPITVFSRISTLCPVRRSFPVTTSVWIVEFDLIPDFPELCLGILPGPPVNVHQEIDGVR